VLVRGGGKKDARRRRQKKKERGLTADRSMSDHNSRILPLRSKGKGEGASLIADLSNFNYREGEL